MPIEATPQGPFLGNIADFLGTIRKLAETSQDSAVEGKQPEKYVLLDVLKQVLRPFENVAERASYGEPLITGGKETIAKGVDPDLAEAGSNFFPGAKIAALAKSLGVAKGGLLAGLTPAGPRNLMMSHGTGIDDLIKPVNSYFAGTKGKYELIPELTAPSLMIQKDALANNFATRERGVTLIPKEGQFDPLREPNVAVFNRDAYTARRGKYRETKPHGYGQDVIDHVESRLAERGLIPGNGMNVGALDPRKTLGQEYTDQTIADMPISRQVAMRLSPDFRSLAQYERSPAGAATLTNESHAPGRWGDEWERLLGQSGKFGGQWNGTMPAAAPLIEEMRASANTVLAGNSATRSFAREMLKNAAQAPSNYAEVKAVGPVPLTGSKWAGAILDTGRDDPARTAALIREMHARGIPVVHKDTFLGLNSKDMVDSSGMGDSNLEIANWLQQQAAKHGSLDKWPEAERALLAQAAPAPQAQKLWPAGVKPPEDPLKQVPWDTPIAPAMSKALKQKYSDIEDLSWSGKDAGAHSLIDVQAALSQMLSQGAAGVGNYKSILHNGDKYKVFSDGTMHKFDPGAGVWQFMDPALGKIPHDWGNPGPETMHLLPDDVQKDANKAHKWMTDDPALYGDKMTFMSNGNQYVVNAHGEIHVDTKNGQQLVGYADKPASPEAIAHAEALMAHGEPTPTPPNFTWHGENLPDKSFMYKEDTPKEVGELALHHWHDKLYHADPEDWQEFSHAGKAYTIYGDGQIWDQANGGVLVGKIH